MTEGAKNVVQTRPARRVIHPSKSPSSLPPCLVTFPATGASPADGVSYTGAPLPSQSLPLKLPEPLLRLWRFIVELRLRTFQ